VTEVLTWLTGRAPAATLQSGQPPAKQTQRIQDL